jgi:hypothetical protein
MTATWKYATLLISEPQELEKAAKAVEHRVASGRQKTNWTYERVEGGLRFHYPEPKPAGTFRKLVKDNLPFFDAGAISAALVGPDDKPAGAEGRMP